MSLAAVGSAVAPIRTVDLRKVYPGSGLRGPGEVVAVDGVHLELASGEFFGLLGPNGAGKSTMIGMLTTRVRPTGGRAYIVGVDVVAHPALAKRYLGVVSQSNTLDRSLNVVENLEFHGRYFGLGAREARRRAADLLEQFRLADRAKASVFALSGGMAQRLMVARALVHSPEILFLDEPTSGIDPQTRLALWDLLRELHAGGQTILLTTHYMEEADALCQRVAIIDHGRVLADGSPEELKRSLQADHVITLSLRGPGVDAFRDEAGGLPGVRRVELADGNLRVYAADSADAGGLFAELLGRAAARGLRVVDVTSSEPTLEAVFLSLTGRDLRE